MKKIIFLFIVLFALFASNAYSWTYDGGWDTDVTGGIDFYTVATLPATPSEGDVVGVSDGANSSDCTSGGGTDYNICIYDGSNWVVAGDGTAAASSGDSVTVNGVGADTTANFVDGKISFSIADGGAGGERKRNFF